MNLDESLSIDIVTKTGQLINLWVDVFFDFAKESLIADSFIAQGIWNLLGNIKFSDSLSSSKLSEHNSLIRLSDDKFFLLGFFLILE